MYTKKVTHLGDTLQAVCAVTLVLHTLKVIILVPTYILQLIKLSLLSDITSEHLEES